MSDNQSIKELRCPRCDWEGSWSETIDDRCADGCCTRFLCPLCEFEGIEQNPEYMAMVAEEEATWTAIADEKPARGENVQVRDSDGRESVAFLCNHCGAEWRDPISGSGMMVDVVQWRVING